MEASTTVEVFLPSLPPPPPEGGLTAEPSEAKQISVFKIIVWLKFLALKYICASTLLSRRPTVGYIGYTIML